MGVFQDLAAFATRSDRPAQSTQIADTQAGRDAYDRWNPGDTFERGANEIGDVTSINTGPEGGETTVNVPTQTVETTTDAVNTATDTLDDALPWWAGEAATLAVIAAVGIGLLYLLRPVLTIAANLTG